MTGARTARVGIEDVAELAGVSVATVSRALRGLPHVAPTTRDRVRTAAASLGYVVDPHASRLAAGKTRTIAMAVPVLNHWYNAQVVAGAEAVLAEAGMDLLLTTIPTTEARSNFIAAASQQKRADAVILLDIRLSPEEAEVLERAASPLVAIGWQHTAFPSVTVDHERATHDAVQHLIALGHLRIGLISGMAGGPMAFTVPNVRRDAYHTALEQAGLDHGPDLEAIGNFTIAGGHEAMNALLATQHAPTAVYAMSDEMAFGALMAIRDAGLRVPDDISIVGFDDHDLAAVVQLTTVNQRVEEHGAVAARALLEHMASGEAQERVMPTELIVRASTRAI